MTRRARSAAVVLALLALGLACRKADEGPADAGPRSGRVANETLGFSLELGPDWLPPSAASETPAVVDLRRRAPKDREFLVPPRFVVTATPTALPDSDSVIDQVASELRAFTKQNGVELERMTTTTRHVDGVPVGDVELAYKARVKASDTFRQVVHRSFVARRVTKESSVVVLTMTVTYLAEDQDIVLPDVLRMFASLRFTEPGTTAEPPAR